MRERITPLYATCKRCRKRFLNQSGKKQYCGTSCYNKEWYARQKLKDKKDILDGTINHRMYRHGLHSDTSSPHSRFSTREEFKK